LRQAYDYWQDQPGNRLTGRPLLLLRKSDRLFWTGASRRRIVQRMTMTDGRSACCAPVVPLQTLWVLSRSAHEPDASGWERAAPRPASRGRPVAPADDWASEALEPAVEPGLMNAVISLHRV
jgi:hypothetical protein